MKKILVHLVGAAVSGAVLVFFVSLVHEPGSIAEFPSKHSENFIIGVVMALAVVFATLLIAVHYVLSYIFFLFGPERRACGLYVEAYAAEGNPQSSRLSLLVVSFDIRREQLRVAGHAYRKGDNGLEPWARWRSRAVSAEESAGDDIDVFYIHEGVLREGDVERDKVLGTTVCVFPLSDKLYRTGSFCDLHVDAKKTLVPQTFEIIRARGADQAEFRKEMSLVGRLAYFLRLATPPEHVFQAFALRRKSSLLERFEGADRGKACLTVLNELK